MRTAFFVDGYNLFYGLLAGTPYKWLHLPKLLVHVSQRHSPEVELVSVDYFTSGVKPDLATRGIASKEAQDTYVRALKQHDVAVHWGRHRLERGRAPRWISDDHPASRQNQVDIWDLEEKETDVHIAISMYRLVAKQAALPADQRIDQIVLVSADTDMTPALRALSEDFPLVRRGVIFPHREGLKREPPGSLIKFTDWQVRFISNVSLAECQFPDRIPTRKKPADKPDYW